MESVIAPPNKPPPTRRHFQFSLREALGLTLFIATLLFIRHTEHDSPASWSGDLTLIALVMLGAAFGEWRSACKGVVGWRRNLKIGLSLCVALGAGAAFAGTTYHNCWRCGAQRIEKYGMFSYVEQWETSERVESLCGSKCKHEHWRFGTSYTISVIADGMPSFDVPVLFSIGPGGTDITEALERIPNATWRRTIVDAMGDPKNRLKYVAFVVAALLLDRAPSNQTEWDAWWQLNEPIFQREPDATKALPLAQKTMNRVRRYVDIHHTDHLIKRDLPGILLP